MTATARYATPGTPGRPNMLVAAERLARVLGYSALMPHQTSILGVLTECSPDGRPPTPTPP